MKLSPPPLSGFVLLFSVWAINAHCVQKPDIPESFVIIETIEQNQEGELHSSFCPGFMLTEYELLTAYRCANATTENLRVYRSTKDCNARRGKIAVKAVATRDHGNEITTVELHHPVSESMVATTNFPYLDLEEPLNCYFITTSQNHQLAFTARMVKYYNVVKEGQFKIQLPTPFSFSGKPIPGAILVNSKDEIIGLNFMNNQIYSPMHGFIVPFEPVTIDQREVF